MDSVRTAELLAGLGQNRLAAYALTLNAADARELLRDVASIDSELLVQLQSALRCRSTVASDQLEPLPQVRRGEDAAKDAAARLLGERLLAEGKVAAFVVAGGQGSRLGASGPKGQFPVGAISGASLFQVFAEKLLHCGIKAGRAIPWCVMTSPENDAETQAFFREHAHFGLNPANIFFFQQGTLPALDDDGQLLLRTATSLFRSPDGHGGSLRALTSSGAFQELRKRGVEHIFYFQVDNPLVDMCDPVLLGWHLSEHSEFSSKVVPKRNAEEKVGVLARINGAAGVIEYSDLPAALRDSRDESGQLRFRAGNIAVHVLDCGFVERIASGSLQLPWHLARKEIACFDPTTGPMTRVGTKFELFIFDALPLAQGTFVMEVERSAEFSPVKNRSGADSVETCRRDSMELHAAWLERVGARIPRNPDGSLALSIEISPRTALGPEDLERYRDHVFPSGQDILL
ncbi:MAG: UDPGP type 1 family protein [Planctomycetes bacterium]|nr:UDPGP type 1 family protein [Planctomycetota bacterium]